LDEALSLFGWVGMDRDAREIDVCPENPELTEAGFANELPRDILKAVSRTRGPQKAARVAGAHR